MNHKSVFTFLGLLLPSLTTADPAVPRYEYAHPSNGICKDYILKNTITSTNIIYGLPKFRDNFDVAASLFNISQLFRQTPEMGAIGYNPISGTKNVTAAYELAGTFCRPIAEKNGKENTVLVATHGLGYDRRYWASNYQPEDYSFVHSILDSGYSIFYYDRLGTGQSQKISGYENQASIQIELLRQLTTDIRDGKYTDTIKAKKIVLVGHSFGSTISAGVIAGAPDIAEGLLLTGYSFPASDDQMSSRYQLAIPSIFANRIATPTHPDLDSGYLMFGDIYAHVETFYHQPDYTIAAAQYAQSISQPAAIGELLTVTLSGNGKSDEFGGRVWVGTGEYDLIVCSGNCDVTFKAEAYKGVYKGAKQATGYVLPGAGHGVNLHVNARGFYEKIVGFLDGGF